MACEATPFLEQFPDAVDVVLVHSDRWTECHRALLEALTDGVRIFLRTRSERLLDEFKETQPCAVCGTLHVSLLYGRERARYLDDNAELKIDINH